ncbi:hypothetical protein [Nannocystis bainbridge]|uniref:Uncharacterized protein n=1 Tax=Nannocystis bainbridge TaxID=2995303 RepID=A0ABT5DRC3_9BACT|nr:hypothetical protein [Nannocystis bainbridge]MDC0716202.1 hypothetical protein [Nannocystis bainbridge]
MIGTLAGVGGVIGGSLLWSRRASAAAPPTSTPPPASDSPVVDLAPLPRATDVKGDLSTNWGETPTDLRPLFMLMEEVARIPGSARVFAVISYRESRFVTAAHNGNATGEADERDSSRRAYKNNKDRNPPLRYADQAAEFGSGGLFGLLAPYFLWTGVPEVGKRAPLLNSPPELVFQPRAAAFGAAVYMQRILANYRVDDLADIKVGWASPSLLKDERGSSDYHDVRARFLTDAIALNVDLTDATTIPPKLDASAWPGVPAVLAGLVGTLPKEVA